MRIANGAHWGPKPKALRGRPEPTCELDARRRAIMRELVGATGQVQSFGKVPSHQIAHYNRVLRQRDRLRLEYREVSAAYWEAVCRGEVVG